MIGARKKIIKKILQAKGFTFVEMLVALTIFVILIFAVTGIFQRTIKAQRSAVASQNIHESMRFALETMSKELRSARRSDNFCQGMIGAPTTGNRVYNKGTNPQGDYFYFLNKYDVDNGHPEGECVGYYIDNNNRLIIRRIDAANPLVEYDEPVTPSQVVVSNLEFIIKDDLITAVNHLVQPQVTIKMKAEMPVYSASDSREYNVQTTISSRYYE